MAPVVTDAVGNDAPLLEITDLSVGFGPTGRESLAVESASLRLERGKTLGLVGESGSGKSVTALSIVRLLAPGAKILGGSIRFQGRELLGADESVLRDIRGARIAMVFQEPMTSLNPLHRIEKQIGEILEIHGMFSRDKRRARTLELLREVGLQNAEQRLDAFPHELSGGQRQRVMIAMALANRPDLLIADEPTTALDVTVQAQILKLLRDLQARYGMAILFITHDLGIVRRMADEVAVMKQGRVVETGATEQVFAAPRHEYTKMLIAAEPKGAAPPADPDAPEVLATRDLRVWFPIKKGFFRRTSAYVKAVDGVVARAAQGPDAGARRRIRLRQDHARSGAAAPDPLRRADPLSRPEHRRLFHAPDAAVAQGSADRVPGSLRLAVAAHVGGARSSRRAC